MLDNLSEKDMIEALQAYVRRAKKGSMGCGSFGRDRKRFT